MHTFNQMMTRTFRIQKTRFLWLSFVTEPDEYISAYRDMEIR